jgi:tetratricopeptide (TPR) repeat protein
MTDEWYVLVGSKIRGPATASELRKRLDEGKISLETPVRAGTDGAWTFVRELPEFSSISEIAAQSEQESVLLLSSRVRAAAAKRKRMLPLLSVVPMIIAVIVVAAYTRNQSHRPQNGTGWGRFAVDPPPKSIPAEVNAIDEAPRPTPPGTNDGAVKDTSPAGRDVAQSVNDATAGDQSPSTPERRPQPVGQTESPSVNRSIASIGSGVSASPAPIPPPARSDSFTIPWPTAQAEAAADELEWERLDTTVREYIDQSGQWDKLRQQEQNQRLHLESVWSKLEDVDRRATAVADTMHRIRKTIGDDNTNNAAVFAPVETPHYVQSLAKTFSLRTRDMSRLSTQASGLMDDFNGTLERLDSNLADQKKTLSRGAELRGEWMRMTRLFAFWTHRDRRIPTETSSRWILNYPNFAPAHVARCITEIHDKSFDKAGEDVEEAIKKDPNWAELYALQSVLLDRAGSLAESDHSLKKARQLTKKTPLAFVDLCDGMVCVRRRNYDAAKARFRTAAKRDHNDPAGNAQLALLLATCPKDELRDPASAIETATTACKATAWNHWWCLDVLGLSYAASGDFERAVGCIHRAKQTAPADVQQLLDERIASYQKNKVPSVTVGDL